MAKTLKQLNKEFKSKIFEIKTLDKIVKKMIKKGMENYTYEYIVSIPTTEISELKLERYSDEIPVFKQEYIDYINDKYGPYFKINVVEGKHTLCGYQHNYTHEKFIQRIQCIYYISCECIQPVITTNFKWSIPHTEYIVVNQTKPLDSNYRFLGINGYREHTLTTLEKCKRFSNYKEASEECDYMNNLPDVSGKDWIICQYTEKWYEIRKE